MPWLQLMATFGARSQVFNCSDSGIILRKLKLCTFLLGLTLPLQDVRDETCLGMDRNDNDKTKKKKKRGPGRKKPVKRPFLEQIEGGIERVRLRMDWQREAAEGGEKGAREMTSARSRWWRRASRDQNLPKNFKRKPFSCPVVSCT